ncbi:ATP-dependent dethiobiotin synthetase BioD [Desulfosarcina cetonica]|uniref:dethiobiotin synthase n=1 Tax=Desulfosarcina cetonica TaxID=90730 RepID=UPI0006D17990|nr:dethiobiotin synthase [Desulfosarcina cetonica]VTR69277.1 ATP-dependent dethiobiotin synthetase BioD [Desulfosarcina cetonica]
MNSKSVFITGTDTGVGKTLVAAILMAGMENGYYWKPIQSGPPADTQAVREMTGLAADRFLPETYRLSHPLSPHAAARREGIRIHLEDFQLPVQAGRLVVEGAGGIMVPINENQLMLDLMKQLALPVILVARSTLGTINHTLLSLDVLNRHGLEILGVVMNGPRDPSNKSAIEYYGRTRVILEIEPMRAIRRDALVQHFNKMD